MEIDVTNPAAVRAALLESLRLSATPIDFEALTREGILGAAKRGWHEVFDMSRLPEHASRQIAEMKSVRKGSVNRVFVRFEKGNAKAAKLYLKLTGKPATGK